MSKHRRVLVSIGLCLIVLLVAGYALLFVAASRASTTRSISIPYAAHRSVLVLIGPQSVCPPYVQCPQVSIKPRAISAWLLDEARDNTQAPIWQMYANIHNRQLFYIRVE